MLQKRWRVKMVQSKCFYLFGKCCASYLGSWTWCKKKRNPVHLRGYRSTPFVQALSFWLLNHVIYLKSGKKITDVKGKQIDKMTTIDHFEWKQLSFCRFAQFRPETWPLYLSSISILTKYQYTDNYT